jgi:hypothetical protein
VAGFQLKAILQAKSNLCGAAVLVQVTKNNNRSVLAENIKEGVVGLAMFCSRAQAANNARGDVAPAEKTTTRDGQTMVGQDSECRMICGSNSKDQRTPTMGCADPAGALSVTCLYNMNSVLGLASVTRRD